MRGLKIEDIYNLSLEYFKYKLVDRRIDVEKSTLEIILYDSITFSLSIGERYETFHAVLLLNENKFLFNLLGEPLATSNDSTSIINTFKRMDEYCRLRLPDKFLEAFEKAHKND